MPGRFTVKLAKQDFKFAAAHFTLFPDGSAELLHGHNYRVSVELTGERLDELGLLVDFERVKRAVRAACARLDGRMLLPERSARLRIARGEGGVEVRCGGSVYRLPDRDIVLLPVANSSVELLARMLWQEVAPALADSGVDELAVEVEETAGQSCRYAAALTRRA